MMAVTGNEPVSVSDLKLACSALIERIAAIEAARTPTQVWSGNSKTATFTDGEPGDIIVCDIYGSATNGGNSYTTTATVVLNEHYVDAAGLETSRKSGTWTVQSRTNNWTLRAVRLIKTQD